ncbi:prefoldin subunit domain-containing protein [Rhizoctonia solani AG-1 IA]|uniref:Prefoldin subunit domain-containing protein n=1 Tax=Thanatephorus cucumeris (strain AG1-IA) TaxID=983506 RepID=L8WWP8_THACA|nr:prefoldin subunit domain-containing protein [Rhizoctonia solani AG-1 IA]
MRMDQQKINTFSKLNTRCNDLEEKIANDRIGACGRGRASEVRNIYYIALVHSSLNPPRYKIGEALFHISLERAQALIQKDQESIEAEINGLQGKIDQCQQEMKDLKVTLYAKFGKQINLD